MAFTTFVLVLSVMLLFTFIPSNAFTMAPKSLKKNSKSLNMVLMDSEVFPGQLPPTGYFDPLGLADVVDYKWLKRYREAELKHGRVCML